MRFRFGGLWLKLYTTRSKRTFKKTFLEKSSKGSHDADSVEDGRTFHARAAAIRETCGRQASIAEFQRFFFVSTFESAICIVFIVSELAPPCVINLRSVPRQTRWKPVGRRDWFYVAYLTLSSDDINLLVATCVAQIKCLNFVASQVFSLSEAGHLLTFAPLTGCRLPPCPRFGGVLVRPQQSSPTTWRCLSSTCDKGVPTWCR